MKFDFIERTTPEPTTIRFKDLYSGDIFYHGADIYVRTCCDLVPCSVSEEGTVCIPNRQNTKNAVCLADGSFKDFADNEPVELYIDEVKFYEDSFLMVKDHQYYAEGRS